MWTKLLGRLAVDKKSEQYNQTPRIQHFRRFPFFFKIKIMVFPLLDHENRGHDQSDHIHEACDIGLIA